MRRAAWAVALAAMTLVGCGGAASTNAPATAGATVPATSTPTAAPTPAASLAAGTIGFRVVNATAGPVDVFVRTQNLVTASLAKAALAVGDVSNELFPPDPGEVVVLPAGTGDPTCVVTCSFVAEASINSGEGNHRILIARGADSTEYWAYPNAASLGVASNALRPADAAKSLVIIEAAGVADGTFGLRVSWAGGNGCVDALDAAGLMLGGTNVLAYAMDPAGGALSFYAGSDTSCSQPPVAGPFTVAAAPVGSRTFVIAWGATGAVRAAILPLP